MSEVWLQPAWPAPANIRALSTTRLGGVSRGPFASLNLGTHVGDDPDAVMANREKLRQTAGLPSEPLWLEQVHGVSVVEADTLKGEAPQADACVARRPGQVCVVMTADCLPVLFARRDGSAVAAAHAGWRGLAAGVLPATVNALDCSPGDVIAWLGPAIGPSAFEVGAEVRDAFVGQVEQAERCFYRHGERWLADLPGLARQQLQGLGVGAVYGGEDCTYSDAKRFFSYRRDGLCGRMASLVWIG